MKTNQPRRTHTHTHIYMRTETSATAIWVPELVRLVAAFAGMRTAVRMWRVCAPWWIALAEERASVVRLRRGYDDSNPTERLAHPDLRRHLPLHLVVLATDPVDPGDLYTVGLRSALFVFGCIRALQRRDGSPGNAVPESLTIRWTQTRTVDDGELVQSNMVIEELLEHLTHPACRLTDLDLDFTRPAPRSVGGRGAAVIAGQSNRRR